MGSELTVTSLFSGDVGRRFHSARLHGITYCDIIVEFRGLCGAACQDMACTVCNPQPAVSLWATPNSSHSRCQFNIPLHCTRISLQSQQKIAAQSSRFCVCLLSRLFCISVIISFHLICYISLFSLCLFVSAILCNSLPWLIYFSLFISLFPYRSAYFFRHLCMSLSFYFFFSHFSSLS
jgi:hypothetical protein